MGVDVDAAPRTAEEGGAPLGVGVPVAWLDPHVIPDEGDGLLAEAAADAVDDVLGFGLAGDASWGCLF